MSLANTVIFEVEFGGSDTACGGGFDPATGARDGTLASSNGTSSTPTVTSANYSFVAGDIGNWLFIKSGTNWSPGWYKITSVSGGAATLNAAIGAAFLFVSNQAATASASAGVGTSATLSSGTWSIDYTQTTSGNSLGSPSISTTTVTYSGATKSMVGNVVQIGSGSGITAGFYLISAVTAGTSFTIDRTAGTGSASVYLGGALASLGQATGAAYSGSAATVNIFQKYSASAYQIATSSTNISGGIVAATGSLNLWGYNTSRYATNVDPSMPVNQLSGVTFGATTAVLSCTAPFIRNIILDCAFTTNARAFQFSAGGYLNFCSALNAPQGGFDNTAFSCYCLQCFVSNCGNLGFSSQNCTQCGVYNSAVVAFTATCNNCIAVACTTGFKAVSGITVIECAAYGCSADGFLINGTQTQYVNCLSYGNGGKGFNNNSQTVSGTLNCAAGANTGSNFDPASVVNVNNVTLTANPFVNSSATINKLSDLFAAFALNNVAGGGASCRGAGLVPYADIGALQHQPTSSVGGSQMMTGGRL